jgi:TatD DNase family protein
MYAGAEYIKLKHDPNEEESLVLENEFEKEKYIQLAQSKKVIAIGEIGLDYYYKPKTAGKLQQFKEKQKQIFIQQLDLAKELDLPVILHCRMAHDDVIAILKQEKINRGVIHCFTGTMEQAKQYVELGFHLGINGIIFKFDIDKIIQEIPLEKLVVETDCPYLTPPMAPIKRNEPVFITYTLQKIAELKGISFEEVCQKTTENAKKLFNI